MATKEQLRALRKKHHLGEFRKSINRVSHSIKQHGGAEMRRKGRKTGRRYGGKSVNVWATIIGVGGYIGYEALISPKVPLVGMVKNLAELGVGLWLSKKGGMMGNIGRAAVVLNTYQLLAQNVAPLLTGATGGTGAVTVYS